MMNRGTGVVIVWETGCVGGRGKISLFILDLTLGPRCLKNNQKKKPKSAQATLMRKKLCALGPSWEIAPWTGGLLPYSGLTPIFRPPTRRRLERLNLSSGRKLTNQNLLSEISHKHREFFYLRRKFKSAI